MWFSIFLQRMRFDRTTVNQKSRYQQSGHDVDAGIYKKGIEAMGMTNGERIRGMSDEELAEIIICPYDTDPSVCNYKGVCLNCCLEWLKQPAEE